MGADSGMLSDSAIVARVLEGNTDEFESLVTRYKAHVMKIVCRHAPYQEAEELAQEVFVRAFTSLGTFGEKSGFRQWLSAVAVRTCYDFWRKRYRSREMPLSELTDNHHQWLERAAEGPATADFAQGQGRKEAEEILRWALARLGPEDRMVLELTHLQGYSGAKAADLLGWSVANVKVRAHRSRKKLRRILTEAMDE